ncbi:MAG: metal-sulfur cluster assembly factor [Thermotogae bacterium]|nr:metal-sulfur cluster assembly factor [Thermotogota bacterium]
MAVTREDVMKKLKEVYDMELGLDIVSLGLIYDVLIEGGNVKVTMTLTTPMCPLGPLMMEDVKRKVGELEGVEEVQVELTFDPPWSPEMMDPSIRQMMGL